MNPTSWNFNPLLPTSNIINYDDSSEMYDNSKQSYDGIAGIAGTVASVIGGKFKMFLGLGFPLTSPGTSKALGGYGIHSQITWKTPTAYEALNINSMQVYYGGPSTVPLDGLPTSWFANASPVNAAGQYEPENNAYAKVRPYDIATLAYDNSATQYDGMNNGQSFENWKAPTAWEPVAGANDF